MIITYNIDINKNRGVGVEDNKDKRFYSTKLFLILVICWVFLKIGSDIHKWQKFDEANERASERAIKRDEIASTNKISRKRERILERSLVKSHLFNLYLKLIIYIYNPSWM